MKVKYLLLLFSGFLLTFFVGSCTHDPVIEPIAPVVEFCDTVSPTYNLEIKAIVDASCAYAGCHNQGAGNFTTYAGMLPFLDDGQIRGRVIDMREDAMIGMPPDYATNGPKNLTDSELALFECWLDSGYPE